MLVMLNDVIGKIMKKLSKEQQKLQHHRDLVETKIRGLKRILANSEPFPANDYFEQFQGEKLLEHNWQIPQMQWKAELYKLEKEKEGW